MNKQSVKIFIHVVGWLAFLILPILFFKTVPPPRPGEALNHIPILLFSSILLIAFFYINYLYLFPNLYLQKRKLGYLLSIIASFFIIFCISIFFIGIINPPPPGPPHFPFPFALNTSLRFVIILFFSCGISIFFRWKRLEEEKMKAEVSYLRAQINPHFLFNTLNSIYSLAVKKSDYTSEAIVKLSNMMRYVISETNHDYVSLEEELNYINSYIDLQKLRLTSKITIDTNISSHSYGLRIAPLLLIPFIENAFKHGVNTEEHGYIKINIDVNMRELHLYSENKKVQIQKHISEGSGLGIENSKQRLQLLYPQNHLLAISDSEEKFCVDLKITLK